MFWGGLKTETGIQSFFRPLPSAFLNSPPHMSNFFFQNDQLLNIYQEIQAFFLSDEWLQRKSTFYVWFVNK